MKTKLLQLFQSLVLAPMLMWKEIGWNCRPPVHLGNPWSSYMPMSK